MSSSIEVTEEIISIKHHLVEGTLDRIESGYVLREVVVDGEAIDVPVNDILRQYEGQDIRIVVLSLADAERMLALAQGMEHGGRDDRG